MGTETNSELAKAAMKVLRRLACRCLGKPGSVRAGVPPALQSDKAGDDHLLTSGLVSTRSAARACVAPDDAVGQQTDPGLAARRKQVNDTRLQQGSQKSDDSSSYLQRREGAGQLKKIVMTIEQRENRRTPAAPDRPEEKD